MKDSTTVIKSKLKAVDLALIAMFAAIIAVCSWITIPMTVPFTLQTLGVFCAVGLLGGKRGTLAVLTYIVMGAIGLPVFAGFTGGIGILATSTGGYLVGFLFSALVYWLVTSLLGNRTGIIWLAMILGLLVCYAFGTTWFMVVYANTTGKIGLFTALGWCVVPFILPDLVKIAAAILLTKKVLVHVRLSY